MGASLLYIKRIGKLVILTFGSTRLITGLLLQVIVTFYYRETQRESLPPRVANNFTIFKVDDCRLQKEEIIQAL